MMVAPIIERELRAQARLPLTYWLRVMGVGVLVLAVFYAVAQGSVDIDSGEPLFELLNIILFAGIWLVVPLMTADCLSRERREGTLGLLFLTPLKARNIVLAKSVVHGSRALMLWLAVVPVLVIPFLEGGVGRPELILSLLVNFSSLCGALAAGLVASACARRWWRAVMLTLLLNFGVFLFFAWVKGVALSLILAKHQPKLVHFNLDLIANTGFLARSVALAANVDSSRRWILRALPPLGTHEWIMAETAQAVGALIFLVVAIEVAAMIVRRNWRDKAPSRVALWWEAVFCKPVVGVAFFHRWLGRKLQRNPIGWLEQRTWQGRLAKWGWLAGVVTLYSYLLVSGSAFQRNDGAERLMVWALLGNLGLSAAGSFRRERENGVLELLLVSPLKESSIVVGRLRGLWGQFLPAWVLLTAVWLYFSHVLKRLDDEQFLNAGFYFVTFATLPIVGLYYSLRPGSFANALFFTLLTGIILPVLAAYLLAYFVAFPGAGMLMQEFCAAVLQIMVAAVLAISLNRKLMARDFIF